MRTEARQARIWRAPTIRFGAACLLMLAAAASLGAQAPDLPGAAEPQPVVQAAQKKPPVNCELRNAAATMAATAAVRADEAADDSGNVVNPHIVSITLCVPHLPIINWYARFLNGPQVKAFTPLEKAHLAGRNLVDPFNLMTIAAESGIAVAANSHSAVGPGMSGFGKSMGVSFTQDLVGEFFGTFLIPSIAHQDPHYHRLPKASVKRRIFHALDQVVWTQGDNGQGMLNYADLVGFAVEDGVNNLYVPGQKTDLGASASRYGIGFALAPVDNVITEFLPDIASHIHVRVVLVQRIINQVARSESGTGP